jgi:murein DD-endopeptidase MepM/ murein hydrolase activator NlpD
MNEGKRRGLQFEEVTRNNKTPEIASKISGDKSKDRQRRNAEEIRAKDTPVNASENSRTVDAPTFGADKISSPENLTGLQHEAVRSIQNIVPNNTPDNNAGVSATRFGMELTAVTVSNAVKSKKKKKQKLQHDKSRLEFSDEENKNGDAEPPVKNEDNQEKSESAVDEADEKLDGDSDDSSDEALDNQDNNSTEESVDSAESGDSADSDKSKSKLKFSKEEKKIKHLEDKADKYADKLEKAREKLPTKTVTKKQIVYDEQKKKNVSKLTHEKEVIPIGEAKWNQPKKVSTVGKVGGAVTSLAVTKIHTKIHQAEHENVGVKTAHKAELLGESAYRGAKQGVRSAYRFHKNSPYRHLAKLEQKSIRNKMKLDYKKALRDNPKLKSNPISRFMQKRAVKRNYAKDLRAAKNAANTGKKAVGITAKVGKIVTAIVRKNPVFLLKLGLLLLLIFLILSMFSMCAALFSGSSGILGSVVYPAEPEDIDDATVLFTELETDLRVEIAEIGETYPGFDEYNFNIGNIGHDPFELMAFLSALYQDFSFEDIEEVIREIFDEMYTLEIVEESETRTRTETHTGTATGTDSEGNSYSYTYTYQVEVEYEYRTLNVTLTSQSFMEVITPRMDEEQTHHFYILMYSKGARQFIGNPFAFDWLPYVSSYYGYRIHPIDNEKRMHNGIDIGLPTGTELLATFDGTVASVANQPDGYGLVVVIENEDGVRVRYAHCDEIFVVAGQTITQGEVIATVGNTGASTGSHLHLEVEWNGRRFNPLFYFEFRD